MTNIILLGRFGLAESMLACAEQIRGRQRNVYPLDTKPGDTDEIFEREFRFVLENLDGNKLVLVDYALGDFPGLLSKFLGRPDIRLVSGFNLPMLLGIFSVRHEEMELAELVDKAIQFGRENIIAN